MRVRLGPSRPQGDKEPREGQPSAGDGQRGPAIAFEERRESHGDDRDEQAGISGAAGADGADDREIESEGARRAAQAEIEKAEPEAEAKHDDGRAAEETSGAGLREGEGRTAGRNQD